VAETLYRKYRPSTFGDVVGQEHVMRTLLAQVASGTTAHAYLFTGPRGVGKTTTARVLAKAVNCLKSKDGEPCNACEACTEIIAGSALDILEIDAATHTGVDNIRETVIEAVRFAPNRLKKKVYVIDEVHMLSTGSFNALLKTLEEPPSHALFILATTEIHKVPPTVISRCQRFDFRRIPLAELVSRLKDLAKREGVKVDDEVIEHVARLADGGLRDAESMLGQLFAVADGKVTAEDAALVLPSSNAAQVAAFVAALADKDAARAVRLVGEFAEQGTDLPHFTDETIETLRLSLHASLAGQPAAFPTERAVRLIDGLLTARRHMKTDKIPQLPLELFAVEACTENFPKPGADSGRAGDVGTEARSDARRSQMGRVTGGGGPPDGGPQRSEDTTDGGGAGQDPSHLRESSTQPPVAVEAVALGDLPVLSLDEVKGKWPEVFAMVKEANASLPLVIQTGEISSVNGGRIEVKFAYALHADTVNSERSRRLLDPVLERVYGKRVHIHGTYAQQEADDTVATILEEFGGSSV
jgi:DNA polymerase III subunit gamma/tau